MSSDDFNSRIANVKTTENEGDFTGAQQAYLALRSEDLDLDQTLIISIAIATCLLRAKMASQALEEVMPTVPEGSDPTVKAMYLSLKAQCLHELGRFAGAMTTAEEAVIAAASIPGGDNELLSETRAQQGFAAAELGRVDEALFLLNDALERYPTTASAPSIALYKAICFEKLAEYKMALTTLVEYDVSHPNSASRDMIFFMGTMWHRLGNMREALHCFNRAKGLETTGKINDADVLAALAATRDEGYGVEWNM